jgi:hypothetical protein
MWNDSLTTIKRVVPEKTAWPAPRINDCRHFDAGVVIFVCTSGPSNSIRRVFGNVLSVLEDASGQVNSWGSESSWGALERPLMKEIALCYKDVEQKVQANLHREPDGFSLLFESLPGALGPFYAANCSVSTVVEPRDTYHLEKRLAKVEHELFELRKQMMRLLSDGRTSWAVARLSSVVGYDPAKAWQKAVEMDSTATPLTNLEELYE